MSMVQVRAMVVFLAVAGLALGACGGGEDRPGQVTSESGGSSSGASGSVSGSGSGGEHDTHSTSKEADAKPAFASGEENTKVEVTLQDYAFVGVPETVKGPNVRFSATIKGGNTHELEVIGADGKAVGEIHSFKTGTTKELAIILQPGTYTLQCLVKEGSKTHADLGMKQTLTVE